MTTTKPKIEPRKPGLVQDAARFIAGVASVSTTEAAPEPLAVGSPEPSTVKGTGKKATMNRRRTGKEVRQLTVYLPPDVEKQLRVVAAQEDRLPSDVIADALKMYFGTK